MGFIRYYLTTLWLISQMPIIALQRLFKNDKGVSPVISILLMVLLVIVLVSIIAWSLWTDYRLDTMQTQIDMIVNGSMR